MRQPHVLPVLEPDDFAMGPVEDYHGRFCLLGWKEKLFGEDIEGWGSKGVHTATLRQCCQDAGHPRIMGYRTANTRKNREAAAAIWGDFLKRIGYVEDGPETIID